jgi:hypothetical protein
LRERGVAAGDLHFPFIHTDFMHQQAQVFLGASHVQTYERRRPPEAAVFTSGVART